MLKNLNRMKHALTEWAIKEGMLDDAQFISQKEWHERHEVLHEDALLVMVIDGSGLYSLFNTGCDLTEFEDLVESFGFCYEQGYAWSIGFYPIENYDYRRLSGTYASKLQDQRWQRKAALVKKEAGYICQDCGAKGSLEAHHCYYAIMSQGFEPWEYPLSAFRALCHTCHETRPVPEIRIRAFLARLSQSQLTGLIDGLDNGFNRFEVDSFIQFIKKATFDQKQMDEALNLLKKNTDLYD
ncbi:HNH endonuclease [Cronobacter turicensis]